MAVIGKRRDLFTQALKGLCIICVVLIHLPWGQSENWSGWLWISVRQIINFAVATFFFLSAYYTKSSEELHKEGIANYYKKRLRRLIVPYIIWATVYIVAIPLATTGKVSDNWLYYYLTGKGPTYFLLALLQFTLLNPLLQRLKGNKFFNVLFWIITPAYLIFYYSYNLSTGKEFQPEQFFCFPWFACYYLGLKYQDLSFRKKISDFSTIQIFAICLGVLLISNIEAFFLYSTTGLFSFAISQITAGSILYSIGIIILFNAFWKTNADCKRNILVSLGDYSMGIFLMHPTFNWIYKFLFLHMPGGIEIYSYDFGFMTIHIAVFVLSVISSFIVSKYLSNRFPQLSIPLGLK